MNGIALSAPFFERLGYGLAIAAFAILALGVMWRLTQSASDSYRFLFRILWGSLIVKMAVATFFLLRFTLLDAPALAPFQPQTPTHPGSITTTPPQPVNTLELNLTPEGELQWDGQTSSLERFDAQLSSIPPETQVRIRPHAATPWDKVIQLTDALNRHGIQSVSYQTDASSTSSNSQ